MQIRKDEYNKNFQRIFNQETNENTAFILMLSIINENLKTIIDVLKQQNKTELTPEDYME